MGTAALAVVALFILTSETLAVADQPLEPVTFTVVDLATRKPVTGFSYGLRVIAPGEVDPKQKREKIKPIEVKSASGTFVVQVPVSCKLELDLESTAAVAGYRHTFWNFFNVLSTDPERKFVVELDQNHQKKGSDGDSTSEFKKATFTVEGTVRSSAGKPVKSFTVAVGPRLEPKGWYRGPDVLAVRDPTGHFSVMLEESGRTRVIVKAEGHAVWEGVVDVARKSVPLTIQLLPGFGVSGRIERPTNAHAPLFATLIPYPKPGFAWIIPDEGRAVATLTAAVDGNGAFQFGDVGPDGYLLRIAGKDVTPVNKLIQVEERDVEVGSIPMIGTGRIVGTIHLPDGLEEDELARLSGQGPPGVAWRFAEVHVHSMSDSGQRMGAFRKLS